MLTTDQAKLALPANFYLKETQIFTGSFNAGKARGDYWKQFLWRMLKYLFWTDSLPDGDHNQEL